jgi:MFS family permease
MQPYSRGQRAAIVAVAFASTVLDGADFTVFLFFMQPLADHLGVTLVDLSTIQASSYLIGIIGGVLFGRFADRRGRRLGLFSTVLLFSVFTIGTALVDSYALLFVVRIIAGIGIGGESGIAFAYVNEAFPGRDQRRGLASGLLQSMFLVGAWVAAWIYGTTSALGANGWRAAFVVLGGAGLVCAAGSYFMPESQLWLQRAATRQTQAPSKNGFDLLQLLRGAIGRRVLIASGLLTASFYGAYAVYMYGPAMWQSVYHLDPVTVGRIGMASAILGMLSYIGGGFLADAIGRRHAYAVTASIGVIGYLTFLICVVMTKGETGADALRFMLPAYLLLQIGYGYFGVQGVWLSELFPTEIRTTAQNAIYYIGRALGAGAAPIGGLLVVRKIGLDVSAAVCLGLIGALLALVISRLLPETRGKDLQL